MTRPILVLGATGFVGRALISALSDDGEDVRPAARGLPVSHRWVRCDLEDPSTIAAALDDVACVYYLVHSVGSSAYRAIDRRCAENFVRALESSGVERVIYLGGVAPRGTPSEHLASRLEVGAILRNACVPALELRASMIVGNGSASWHIVRDLAARLPFMVLPRWLESKSRPIALPDVISALLDARTLPLEASAWFDLPGPDTLTVREMLMLVAELQGRRIPAVRVPLLSPGLSALWLRLISGEQYHLARELVLGLREDLLPKDERYWELVGHRPRWSFHDAAEDALATERRQPMIARWIERAVHRLGPTA
jgi:uncharacterized protein YbjT (DUF2867 family)